MTIIELPYPPSTNTYWRHPSKGPLAGRHLISEKGRAYRTDVQEAILLQRIKPIAGRLAVEILAFPPDRRQRDTDNILKALLDGITHAGVWGDDSQIRRHSVEFADEVVKGGKVIILIQAFEPVLAESLSRGQGVCKIETTIQGMQP